MALPLRLATHGKNHALIHFLSTALPPARFPLRVCRKQRGRQGAERILRSGMELSDGKEPGPRFVGGRQGVERSLGRSKPGSDQETRRARQGCARSPEEVRSRTAFAGRSTEL